MDELLPGVYEHLVTRGLAAQVAALDPRLVDRAGLDEADAHTVLTRHLAGLASRALRQVGTGPDALARQVELANRLTQAIVDAAPRAATVEDLTDPSADVLLDIAPDVLPFRPRAERPETPLSASALLVNGHGQPRIGHEVVRELASAAGVDLLCAFIRWEGLRILLRRLEETLNRGVPVRVLTTTYIGATQRRALDALVELGAEVRISYDTRSTRLHAKAWLFRREHDLTTAYVGSSNLSRTAMIEGLEWNVRLSAAEQPHLIDTFTATFDSYWADPSFEPYDPTRDGDRLDRALAIERGGSVDQPLSTSGPTATSRRSSTPCPPSGRSTAVGGPWWSWPPVPPRPSCPRWTTPDSVRPARFGPCCSWPTARRSSARAGRCSGRCCAAVTSGRCWSTRRSPSSGRSSSPPCSPWPGPRCRTRPTSTWSSWMSSTTRRRPPTHGCSTT